MTTKDDFFNSIEDAIKAIARGEIIVVVDDEDRENEGDLICAAEAATPEIINFMAKYGRGLICLPLDAETVERLNLPLMVSNNNATMGTNFTVIKYTLKTNHFKLSKFRWQQGFCFFNNQCFITLSVFNQVFNCNDQ